VRDQRRSHAPGCCAAAPQQRTRTARSPPPRLCVRDSGHRRPPVVRRCARSACVPSIKPRQLSGEAVAWTPHGTHGAHAQPENTGNCRRRRAPGAGELLRCWCGCCPHLTQDLRCRPCDTALPAVLRGVLGVRTKRPPRTWRGCGGAQGGVCGGAGTRSHLQVLCCQGRVMASRTRSSATITLCQITVARSQRRQCVYACASEVLAQSSEPLLTAVPVAANCIQQAIACSQQCTGCSNTWCHRCGLG
jgi:hypothetical protein